MDSVPAPASRLEMSTLTHHSLRLNVRHGPVTISNGEKWFCQLGHNCVMKAAELGRPNLWLQRTTNRAKQMISYLLRAALVLTLLLATPISPLAAEAPAIQKRIEELKKEKMLAQLRNDSVAVERLDRELKTLESLSGLSSPAVASGAPAPQAASVPASLPPAPSFFSAPAGTPPPASTTTLFSLPATSAASSPLTTYTPPPDPRPSVPPVATPTPAIPTFTAPAPAPAPKPAVPSVGTFSTPAAAAALPPVAVTVPGFAASPAVAEPRPAELPPAVLELRAAQSELSRLEEFRMAESLTSRRTTTPAFEPARTPSTPPPPAVVAPTSPFPSAPAPTVNLVGTTSDAGRRLEELTRRRSELQLEAERLSKDNVDWEARYNAAKAELARLEGENKGRGRLDTIREEIVRLDADATRLMQEIEANRADQERRARELITSPAGPASFATMMRDRPMVPALGAAGIAGSPAPAAKGPQFLPVGSLRPPPPAVGDGNIVRTGRTGDPVAIQRELERLNEKRELMLRELEDAQAKFSLAQRELAGATRTGIQADMDRWTKESATLDLRYKTAAAELARLDSEQQSRILALKGAMAPADPDTVNPGDVIRLIVAEDDSYTANYPVKRDGTIVVKSLGRVAIGGKNISDAEAAIKAQLEESQLTKATVTLEFLNKPEQGIGTGGGATPVHTDQHLIIYLAGEFITPGPLKVPEGAVPTLITTIIRSGGVTPSGDLTRAKLLRIENGQGAVEEVNVAAILSGNIPPTDIALNAGDIIMIPAFAPVVYVTGNVNKPGTLRLFQDETLTAYSAILRAGGFARFANLKKCSVVRDLGNGEKIQMPLNVKEIQRGLGPDIVLQGKDIVIVPESFFSF